MKSANNLVSAITHYVNHDDTLPLPQLRRLGLIYNNYRFAVSFLSLLTAYISARAGDSATLPSFLQQTTLVFYVVLSLILLGLFYVLHKQMRRQLALGLTLDVIFLSLLLYTVGAPDLQLTMLYMVVVAASFMLLHTSQALIITLLAIIFVIYQQFFYAIANSMSLTNLGDALLMSASFLAVGGLSWSISQRLVLLEKIAERHVKEVERLNTINQEVVTQMINGVIVIDNQHIVLANTAAYQLLDIPSNSLVSLRDNSAENDHRRAHSKGAQYNAHSAQLTEFQEQLNEQHSQLLEACLTVATGQSRTFTYDLQIAASVFKKLRVQIIPLKDGSKLVILEDLRREQASAQQLKLASLGQLTASIAHEIRNPLATISQASQLLMEDITEPPHQETNQIENKHSTTNTSHSEIAANHELYNMIFSQTKRVNRIIEDILKLSRQHQANQKEIMLAEWLPTFLENYYQDHDVFLNITAQPTVSFDTHQLEQVLINLINNGLRYSSYSHPHAFVEIEAHCVDNDVIIDILDIGTGVSTDDLQHLFSPFFTTDETGTGLGLYLSQSFCEANQARLLYIPEHEKTCFRLIIPAINPDAG